MEYYNRLILRCLIDQPSKAVRSTTYPYLVSKLPSLYCQPCVQRKVQFKAKLCHPRV